MWTIHKKIRLTCCCPASTECAVQMSGEQHWMRIKRIMNMSLCVRVRVLVSMFLYRQCVSVCAE